MPLLGKFVCFKSKIIEDLQQELLRVNQVNETMNREMKLVKERQHNHENYLRKNNLLIDGIEEKSNENLSNVFEEIVHNTLQLTEAINIDTIHRLGRPTGDRKRSVIVRFLS